MLCRWEKTSCEFDAGGQLVVFVREFRSFCASYLNRVFNLGMEKGPKKQLDGQFTTINPCKCSYVQKIFKEAKVGLSCPHPSRVKFTWLL